jgi:hypothetical protein
MQWSSTKGLVKRVPIRLRRAKRRKEPRFWVVCQPEYETGVVPARLKQLTVTIRNDSDLPHGLDEALIRYDDGRVGLGLPLSAHLVERIPPHQSVTLQVNVSQLLEPGSATRLRVVVYRGKTGRRQEWSSKEERFVAGETTPGSTS